MVPDRRVTNPLSGLHNVPGTSDGTLGAASRPKRTISCPLGMRRHSVCIPRQETRGCEAGTNEVVIMTKIPSVAYLHVWMLELPKAPQLAIDDFVNGNQFVSDDQFVRG